MPPRIGLPTYREQARWGAWDRASDLLPTDYAARVQEAGGLPLLLPPADAQDAELALGAVHGLVLTGGADIDPTRYGAEKHQETGPLCPERDSWEFALVSAALACDMPILGICRGLQLLNVARGGTLIQYLPDVVGHHGHRLVDGQHGIERVTVAPGSRLAELVGAQLDVATHHRQGIGRLGRGLVATAWAADGTIEAAELPDARWVIAVQWHPEISGAGDLFRGLVGACRTTMAVRS